MSGAQQNRIKCESAPRNQETDSRLKKCQWCLSVCPWQHGHSAIVLSQWGISIIGRHTGGLPGTNTTCRFWRNIRTPCPSALPQNDKLKAQEKPSHPLFPNRPKPTEIGRRGTSKLIIASPQLSDKAYTSVFLKGAQNILRRFKYSNRWQRLKQMKW